MTKENNINDASTVLVEEYGVVLVRNALCEAEQKALWAQIKPRAHDPATRAMGLSLFSVSTAADPPKKRVAELDAVGEKLYRLAAEQFVSCVAQKVRSSPKEGGASTAVEPKEETHQQEDQEAQPCSGDKDAALEHLKLLAFKQPSFRHLLKIHSEPERPIDLGELRGNVYKEDAKLFNHVDSDKVLFTMSLSLGDTCDFVIGKPYAGSSSFDRNAERKGAKVHKLKLRSGDALFFDGGLVPHEVGKITPKTAPKWWEGEKVPNGSRCVVLFREKETVVDRKKKK